MLDQSRYETMLIEKQDGIAIITLNRPERLNAVNGVMHSELMQFSLDIQADTDVRAAVLTGAGRAFCAGGDFGPGSRMAPKSGLPMMQEARRIVDNLLDLEKPIVAAVNGAATGLGATIALLCDSKYNAIERYWAGLAKSWNGYLLSSMDAAISRAGNFCWKGVRTIASLVDAIYVKGVKICRGEKRGLEQRLQRSTDLIWWDITIHPKWYFYNF